MALLLATPLVAQAHVKWFADFSFADPPREFGDILTPTFFALVALSFVALGVAVFIESRIDGRKWYQQIIDWFEERRDYSTLVMRIGVGVTMMLSWQADTLLMPDLQASELQGIVWLQFIVALLLLFPRTTPVAGAGLLGLYLVGVFEFGAFYMLDYFMFVGIAVYLILSQVENERLKALRIPALYFSVGFSLCWLAVEKVVYPDWGLYLLEQNPELSLGFDIDFFLLGAAFVEFSLGYLLIIGVLERPLALVITLVFFGTTLIFGKVEIIGHTVIHASLIVFLLEGPGKFYPAPIDLHERTPTRMAFASVNFLIFLAVILVPYNVLAQAEYDNTSDEVAQVMTERAGFGDGLDVNQANTATTTNRSQ